jgi:hypothetical protein
MPIAHRALGQWLGRASQGFHASTAACRGVGSQWLMGNWRAAQSIKKDSQRKGDRGGWRTVRGIRSIADLCACSGAHKWRAAPAARQGGAFGRRFVWSAWFWLTPRRCSGKLYARRGVPGRPLREEKDPLRYIERALIAFFAAIFTVGAIVTLITSDPGAGSLARGFAAFEVAIATVLWIWFWKINRAVRNAVSKVETLGQTAKIWLDQVTRGGLSPEPKTGTVILPENQLALLAETSTRYEFRADNRRAYVGTRLKVGSLPAYVGGARTLPHTALRSICTGQLVLTNLALIFASQERAASIKLEELISIEPSPDFIVVAERSRATSYVFSVNNPILWAAAARLLAEGKLMPAT